MATRTKRTTSSAACMDPERIRNTKDIRSSILMLKLDPAGKPYIRLDVVLALASTALFKNNFDCLECLGHLSRNAEWHITLSNEESKLKLINETPITSSWAEEITDKELEQWVTSSEAERRRRRQERSMAPFSSIPVFPLEQQSPKIYLSRPKVLYILVSSRL
ncbi:hypothetical protein LSH36_860g00029 [Paralvinella palmiformis]|uniref:Uncharacterized protein n=1 Tax=Paralvinella palmiformis TaxID=53620 RepID=A0AAD9IYG9_9ANNE|nr:hypothetical protein LSH36_860g00029 [Paralvinella palmiformis]